LIVGDSGLGIRDLIPWQKVRTLAIGRTQNLPNPQAVGFKSLITSTGMRGAFITRIPVIKSQIPNPKSRRATELHRLSATR
jgi:hypothetical protein